MALTSHIKATLEEAVFSRHPVTKNRAFLGFYDLTHLGLDWGLGPGGAGWVDTYHTHTLGSTHWHSP